MRALGDRARAGTLAAGDMHSGCFSVSPRSGGVGGAGFAPSSTRPEVAILAPAARPRGVWDALPSSPVDLPVSCRGTIAWLTGVAAARFLGHNRRHAGRFPPRGAVRT